MRTKKVHWKTRLKIIQDYKRKTRVVWSSEPGRVIMDATLEVITLGQEVSQGGVEYWPQVKVVES